MCCACGSKVRDLPAGRHDRTAATVAEAFAGVVVDFFDALQQLFEDAPLLVAWMLGQLAIGGEISGHAHIDMPASHRDRRCLAEQPVA